MVPTTYSATSESRLGSFFVQTYDPAVAPNPVAWLKLDEDKRISMVLKYHRDNRLSAPRPEVHAALHVIVENQIALGHDSVVRALARLRSQGCSRHEALHATGSVLIMYINDLLKPDAGMPTDLEHKKYSEELDQLTLDSWRKQYQN